MRMGIDGAVAGGICSCRMTDSAAAAFRRSIISSTDASGWCIGSRFAVEPPNMRGDFLHVPRQSRAHGPPARTASTAVHAVGTRGTRCTELLAKSKTAALKTLHPFTGESPMVAATDDVPKYRYRAAQCWPRREVRTESRVRPHPSPRRRHSLDKSVTSWRVYIALVRHGRRNELCRTQESRSNLWRCHWRCNGGADTRDLLS